MPYVVLTFLSLLWGTSFLLIKIAAGAFDWASYASGRAGIAAVALIAFALVRGMRWPRTLAAWSRMGAISLTGQVGPFLLTGVAAHLTTSADLALMMGSAPIFTVIIARLFGLGEVWSGRAGFGLALGLAGVAIALAGPLRRRRPTQRGTPRPGWAERWRCSPRSVTRSVDCSRAMSRASLAPTSR